MRRPSPSALARPAALVAAAAVLVTLAAAPAAATAEDPALEQRLDAGAPLAGGTRVLDAGHVDMGPRMVDGTWRFLVHDDLAKDDPAATSVWREPDRTVLHVVDAARLEAPDDPAYRFVGAEPGAPVWVVPQTQEPEVVWLGWNTQDPEVMASVDRGVTLSLTDVQGPGQVSVYLQSGSFGEPQVLWSSTVDEPQPVWVDVNTHTHASWVFTQPGVYLLRLTAEADLLDGSTVADTQVLRFAVGSATSTDEALAAAWAGEGDGAAGAPEAGQDAATTDVAPGPGDTAVPAAPDRGVLVPVLTGAVVLVAVAVVGGFVVAGVRAARTRRRVLAGAGTTPWGPSGAARATGTSDGGAA